MEILDDGLAVLCHYSPAFSSSSAVALPVFLKKGPAAMPQGLPGAKGHYIFLPFMLLGIMAGFSLGIMVEWTPRLEPTWKIILV